MMISKTSGMNRAVALLAEGVDRNDEAGCISRLTLRSPSSRRAWIEIARTGADQRRAGVALLAEGVDRNQLLLVLLVLRAGSPSSRRAWIEILCLYITIRAHG